MTTTPLVLAPAGQTGGTQKAADAFFSVEVRPALSLIPPDGLMGAVRARNITATAADASLSLQPGMNDTAAVRISAGMMFHWQPYNLEKCSVPEFSGSA